MGLGKVIDNIDVVARSASTNAKNHLGDTGTGAMMMYTAMAPVADIPRDLGHMFSNQEYYNNVRDFTSDTQTLRTLNTRLQNLGMETINTHYEFSHSEVTQAIDRFSNNAAHQIIQNGAFDTHTLDNKGNSFFKPVNANLSSLDHNSVTNANIIFQKSNGQTNAFLNFEASMPGQELKTYNINLGNANGINIDLGTVYGSRKDTIISTVSLKQLNDQMGSSLTYGMEGFQSQFKIDKVNEFGNVWHSVQSYLATDPKYRNVKFLDTHGNVVKPHQMTKSILLHNISLAKRGKGPLAKVSKQELDFLKKLAQADATAPSELKNLLKNFKYTGKRILRKQLAPNETYQGYNTIRKIGLGAQATYRVASYAPSKVMQIGYQKYLIKKKGLDKKAAKKAGKKLKEKINTPGKVIKKKTKALKKKAKQKAKKSTKKLLKKTPIGKLIDPVERAKAQFKQMLRNSLLARLRRRIAELMAKFIADFIAFITPAIVPLIIIASIVLVPLISLSVADKAATNERLARTEQQRKSYPEEVKRVGQDAICKKVYDDLKGDFSFGAICGILSNMYYETDSGYGIDPYSSRYSKAKTNSLDNADENASDDDFERGVNELTRNWLYGWTEEFTGDGFGFMVKSVPEYAKENHLPEPTSQDVLSAIQTQDQYFLWSTSEKFSSKISNLFGTGIYSKLHGLDNYEKYDACDSAAEIMYTDYIREYEDEGDEKAIAARKKKAEEYFDKYKVLWNIKFDKEGVGDTIDDNSVCQKVFEVLYGKDANGNQVGNALDGTKAVDFFTKQAFGKGHQDWCADTCSYFMINGGGTHKDGSEFKDVKAGSLEWYNLAVDENAFLSWEEFRKDPSKAKPGYIAIYAYDKGKYDGVHKYGATGGHVEVYMTTVDNGQSYITAGGNTEGTHVKLKKKPDGTYDYEKIDSLDVPKHANPYYEHSYFLLKRHPLNDDAWASKYDVKQLIGFYAWY